MDVKWEEYGNILAKRTTGSGGNLYWKIKKGNNRIIDHVWALNLINENISSTKNKIDELITSKSQTSSPSGKTMEERGRTLLLSKVLGFLFVHNDYYQLTNAYTEFISKDKKQIISNQLEKFYYFNSIFSPTNRHVARDSRISPDDYFQIYPIFFIYEILVILKEKYGFDPVLSKFELECFLFLAQKQFEIYQVAEKINDFRNSVNKEQIEIMLKSKNTMDSRIYAILENCIHFTWESTQISIDKSNYERIKNKVSMFNDLKENNCLIEWSKTSEKEYFDMLYSKKDFFDYHYSASIKTT